MIIDRIMHSYSGLEREYHQNNSPMPVGILLSLDAYKEIPPQYAGWPLEDLKVCGLPVSIADTNEFEFKWVFPNI